MISRVMDGLLRVYSSPPSVTLQNCDQQRAPRARSMLYVSRGEEQEQHPAESSSPWGKVTKSVKFNKKRKEKKKDCYVK